MPTTSRIELDFPYSPRSRFGHGQKRHPELDAIVGRGRRGYADLLGRCLSYEPDLAAIAVREPDTPDQPTWVNDYFGGIDCVVLYGLLRETKPARYVEAGSGESTRWARRALADAGASTEIVSIDPQPRAEIDVICDRTIRAPLEDVDLAVFEELGPGDVVFMDGSHRALMNSDATVFFLEVLPRLPEGVLVHVHDVFLPDDYPPAWTDRHYSEQYLLAAWLLGGGSGAEIVFPSWYVLWDADLQAPTRGLWESLALAPDEYQRGCSFWIRTSRGPGVGRLP